MGVFSKAAAGSVVKKPSAKGTAWLTNEADGKSVDKFVDLTAEKKKVEAKIAIPKGSLVSVAFAKYLESYVRTSVPPETPMTLVAGSGNSVTFVVQDRSGQGGLSEEQIEDLTTLLGSEVVDGIVYDEISFSFNRDVLAAPGVMSVIEKHLGAAISEIVESGLVSGEAADQLLEAEQRKALRPGVFQRLVSVCGANVARLERFLGIVGGLFVKYVK